MSVETLDYREQAFSSVASQESGFDRRSHPRVRLALPLSLFKVGEADRIDVTTEDVSCDSLSFVSDRPFSADDRLECELLVVPGDALSSVPEDDLCLRCEVRVVRVEEKGPQLGFAVACRMEDYTITRSAR
jgi:PilZ domain